MKKCVTVEGAATPAGPYSHAVIANGLVFVSGQGPVNPATGQMQNDVRGQVRQTLENIRTILKGVGADMQDVVKVHAYLTDLGNFEDFNEVYAEFFADDHPARTTVGAQLNNILVEIDCIAVLPSK